MNLDLSMKMARRLYIFLKNLAYFLVRFRNFAYLCIKYRQIVVDGACFAWSLSAG